MELDRRLDRNSDCIIGVDIGTTSTKAVLFTTGGRVLDEHSIGYPLLSSRPEVQEQDPEQIYSAVVGVVRTVVERSVKPGSLLGLSFSAAMHSLIAVDRQHTPLTLSITWADRRSARWLPALRQRCNTDALYRRTGTPIHPMSPLLKLIWLRQEHPALFEQAAKFISIKEFVLYRWFQTYVVDYSIANATGLFNLETLDWDSEALQLAHIMPQQLSTIVPATHGLTGMSAIAAAALGVPAELPVVVGSSDGVLANLGVGAISPETVAVTVGTSGAVRVMVNQSQTDPQQRLFCYALSPERWLLGGAINNGGIVLRWVRDTLTDSEVATARLLKRDAYNILTEIAATVPAGADGLIFHPYLAGERSPLWDTNARGSFLGLGLNHTKAHLIRAVLEGIIYNLYAVSLALQDAVGPTTSIRATGGFARSPLWRQMLADVFNRTVLFPENTQGSSFGAAALGLYALGQLSSLDEVPALISHSHSHSHAPIAQNVERYQAILPLYLELLERLAPLYGKIASLQQEPES